MRRIAIAAALIAGLAAATPAEAAKQCAEPGAEWTRATPAEAGMDAAKLQEAVDYGTSNLGFAVRVYRHGCLVAEDRAAPQNRAQRYESWSMAKSVTAMAFGAAMTKGLASANDPVGSLIPEADKVHGEIALRDLLTQTSGLLWNGFRDYNIFTMPDRVRDALTLPPAHKPGTYFEYAQSPVALLAEATGRAAGEDVQGFLQREVLNDIGIPKDNWSWTRDQAGHVQGFFGVQMVPDDYARLGDLLRRGGVWKGKRLLSDEFIREATAATPTNGCYGWLIWVNSAEPCIGPRITERPVADHRDFPDLPTDMYRFSGLFGQLVTVFPTQDVLVVRTGQDRGLAPTGGESWEHGLYTRVMAAVTDQKIVAPGPPAKFDPDRSNADYGFQNAFSKQDEYGKGAEQDDLPPAGPARARAVILQTTKARATKKGSVLVRILCPKAWPSKLPGCEGEAKLEGSRKAVEYSIAPGQSKRVRFVLKRKLKAKGRRLDIVARTFDAANGTTVRSGVTVTRP